MRFGFIALMSVAFLRFAAATELKSGVMVRDQFPPPFVRGVMASAPRSIAIPLGTNLHVAFDAERLRVHAAWLGDAARPAGYSVSGLSDAVMKIKGVTLWSMPAECPWSGDAVRSNRFRGVSTKPGVNLFYEIGDSRGWARVTETPSAVSFGTNVAIKRKVDIARGVDALQFTAFAESAELVVTNAHVAVLRRANDLVAVHHSGAGALAVTRDSNGVARVNALLPASTNSTPVTFEITTLVCATNTDPQLLATNWDKQILPLVRPAALGPLEFAAATNAARVDGDEFFKREQVPMPKEFDALVGGLDWLPDGSLAVVTWPGEIYIARGITTNSLTNIVWRRFASGLHEPLGIVWKNGSAYVASKAELTRITDTDANGEADLFETVSDAWGFDGDIHYFAYGPATDAAGNFYVPLDGNTGDWRARWAVQRRGWMVKVRADGVTEPFAAGLRSPNGVFSFGGDIFCTDNEGYWIGACKINCCRTGKFFGYPSSSPTPHEGFDKPARFDPPALWFPRKLAPSASGGVAVNDTRFGPFTNQLFVGDFFTASLLRVALEQVNGEWQGAVWPFMKNFLSGANRVSLGPDGKVYVGSLKRAWTSTAPQDFAIERLTFTGKVPFEIREVKAQRDGFELTFTSPVDPKAAADTNSWSVSQFGYHYHSKYGSQEIDHAGKENSSTPIAVTKCEIAPDNLHVRLTLAGWKTNYVTTVKSSVTSAVGGALWHDTFYYTLNQLPK